MSSDELDRDAIAAVRERVERKLEAERMAAERTLKAARRLRDAAQAAGQATSLDAWMAGYTRLDVAVFAVDDPADGWHADVCVIPAGLAKVTGEAIHECRERLAEELLRKLREAARPDGTWPEAEMTKVVKAWLLDHGANPDADGR